MRSSAAARPTSRNAGSNQRGQWHSDDLCIPAPRSREECPGVTAEPAWGTMSGASWDTSIWVGPDRGRRRELGWQATH